MDDPNIEVLLSYKHQLELFIEQTNVAAAAAADTEHCLASAALSLPLSVRGPDVQEESGEEYSESSDEDEQPVAATRKGRPQPKSANKSKQKQRASPSPQQPRQKSKQVSSPDDEESSDEDHVNKRRQSSAKQPKRSGGTQKHSRAHTDSSSDTDESVEVEAPSPKVFSRNQQGSPTSSAEAINDLSEWYKEQNRMTKTKTQVAKEEAAKLKQQIADMEKKMKEQQEANQHLQVKYQVAVKQGGGLQNAGMVQQIKSVVKRHLWRTVKFLGDEEDEMEVTEKVLDMLNLENYTPVPTDSEEKKAEKIQRRANWVATYRKTVREGLNDQRSYTQSQQKSAALDYIRKQDPKPTDKEKKDEFLPTVDEMTKVVMRDLAHSDKNEQAHLERLFDWYVTEMLPACARSRYWPEKLHGQVQVSSHLVDHVDGKYAVPPSTEAMCLVMYENCRDRWINMYVYKDIDGHAGEIPRYSKKKHEETAQWAALWSDNCSGQQPYGGWDDAGIDKFDELCEKIAKNRKENADHIKKIEKAAVLCIFKVKSDILKEKRKAAGKDVEDEPSPKKKKAGAGLKSARKRKRLLEL